MNTLLGNYAPKGTPVVLKFIVENWPLVCEWAGVPAPTIGVPAIGNHRLKILGDSLFFFALNDEGKMGVFLNHEEIQTEFYAANLDPTCNAMAFLWGLLVRIVRDWLRETGQLPVEEALTFDHVRAALARYPEDYRRAYVDHLREGKPDAGDGSCAQYLAEIAIWWLPLDAAYDGSDLAAIVRARASTFGVSLQPPPQLPPLR